MSSDCRNQAHRDSALRALAHAQLRLLSTDDAARVDARDHAQRALFLIEALLVQPAPPTDLVAAALDAKAGG